jgi:uncharacterized protein (DUF2141 family)
MNTALAIFCFTILSLADTKNAAATLKLRFEGIERANGTIRLALYRSQADFMQEDKATLYNFPVDKKGTLEGKIETLPAGTYAFAVFLDENNNLALDKNLMGVPTEPYGFSKIPPSKWRLPTWKEVKFDLPEGGELVTVSLKRWALF